MKKPVTLSVPAAQTLTRMFAAEPAPASPAVALFQRMGGALPIKPPNHFC